MPTSYAPLGESPSDLWLERSNLVGSVLGGVAYGVHAAVFAECLYRIPEWSTRKSSLAGPGRLNRRWLLMAYVSILFLLSTVNLACNTKMTQLMFIDNRAYPGGPNAWFFDHYSDPTNTAGNASYIIANFFADGLLLWRTYRLWNSFIVVLFPCLVFLGSTAMSILTLFQSSRSASSLWTKTTVQFSLPYFSISIALNIMLTLLLIIRLIYMSRNARLAISNDHGRPYISIAAMILESATPYAIVGLMFIITYARNSNVQNLILPVLGQIMCINPEIIILRVAMGRATESKPYSNSTTIKFASRTRPETCKSTDFELSNVNRSQLSTGPTGSGPLTLGSSVESMKGAVV